MSAVLPTVFPLLRSTVIAVCLGSSLAMPVRAQPAPLDAVELKFGSFFRQPVGPRGLEIADSLHAADGQRVRIVGHMVVQEQPTPGRFLLTPRPLRLSEHADGDADDLPPQTVTVLLDPLQAGRVVAHQSGPLALTGRLQVGRDEGADGRVSWVRLLLDPQALAPSALAAMPAAHTPSH